MKVRGSISMIFKGLNIDPENYPDLIGVLLKDKDGNVVGEITHADIENDTFCGEIYEKGEK